MSRTGVARPALPARVAAPVRHRGGLPTVSDGKSGARRIPRSPTLATGAPTPCWHTVAGDVSACRYQVSLPAGTVLHNTCNRSEAPCGTAPRRWCHWRTARLGTCSRGWLIGTSHGVSQAPLPVDLDECVVRHNRRWTPHAACQTLLGFGTARAPTPSRRIRHARDVMAHGAEPQHVGTGWNNRRSRSWLTRRSGYSHAGLPW